MNQAQRVYLKHKLPQQHQSPFFKSNVKRTQLDPLADRRVQPGPGSYDIILPIVKPKYEAIFKNNRSIIIKVNEVPSPAFYSRQARFKQFSTIDSTNKLQTNSLRQFQKEYQIKIKNSKRYNFSMARKKSYENESNTMMILTNKNNINYQPESSKKKGSGWSKYKQQRHLWQSHINNPGPGSYQTVQKQLKHRFDPKNSWQFRSSTKRYSLSNSQYSPTGQQEQKINSIHSRHNLLQPSF